MNYLEIINEVRSRAGVQGVNLSSIDNAVGLDLSILGFVKDSYIDLQSKRDSFRFLDRERSFYTSVGKRSYTLLDIFQSNSPPLKRFQLDSFYVTNLSGKKIWLYYLDRKVMRDRYLNSTNQSIPAYFTVTTTNGINLRDIPNDSYLINFNYYRNPELLSTDSQAPALPSSFHMLIVYMALEKLGVFLNQPELYTTYANRAEEMMKEMMRDQVENRKICMRAIA